MQAKLHEGDGESKYFTKVVAAEAHPPALRIRFSRHPFPTRGAWGLGFALQRRDIGGPARGEVDWACVPGTVLSKREPEYDTGVGGKEVTETWFSVDPIEWSSPDGQAARSVRISVFIKELGVPIEGEFDSIDEYAFHVLARDERGQPCGTGRLYPDATHRSCARIGRMAVKQEVRENGCGRRILTALLEEARRRGFVRVVLASHTRAMGFYEKFGFRPIGRVQLEHGIAHREMELQLGQNAT